MRLHSPSCWVLPAANMDGVFALNCSMTIWVSNPIQLSSGRVTGFSPRQGNELCQEGFVCLKEPTMASKPIHLFMAGKLDPGPEYSFLAGGTFWARFFGGATCTPSAFGEAVGAARATMGQ